MIVRSYSRNFQTCGFRLNHFTNCLQMVFSDENHFWIGVELSCRMMLWSLGGGIGDESFFIFGALVSLKFHQIVFQKFLRWIKVRQVMDKVIRCLKKINRIWDCKFRSVGGRLVSVRKERELESCELVNGHTKFGHNGSQWDLGCTLTRSRLY